MQSNLPEEEIISILKNEDYGHLGYCTERTKPYVQPITYCYKDHAIYSFAFEGEKIKIMRGQPHVCFQVQQTINPQSWKSVMLWGTYKELSGDERIDAITLIASKLWDEAKIGNSLYMPFNSSREALDDAKKGKDIILYKIEIETMSGRSESYSS